MKLSILSASLNRSSPLDTNCPGGRVSGLGALGQCLCNGRVDGQELVEPCYLDYRAALFRQSRQCESLPLASAVNKELHQCPHTCGVEERYAIQIKNEMSRRLRPQGLDEIVHGLEA